MPREIITEKEKNVNDREKLLENQCLLWRERHIKGKIQGDIESDREGDIKRGRET